MQPNFTIKLPDDQSCDLVCATCGHCTRMTREAMKILLDTTLFGDNCPQCQAPYYDWTPASQGDNEFTKFGASVAEVMAHRSEAEDYELCADIGFILLEKEEQRGLSAFSAPERYVYAVQALSREVNNGGFEQFFYNSSGQLAFDVVPALVAMGSKENLSIATQALERFGKPESLSDASRWEHLDKITRSGETRLWDDLDEAFYENPEDIEGMILGYIESHIDRFAS